MRRSAKNLCGPKGLLRRSAKGYKENYKYLRVHPENWFRISRDLENSVKKSDFFANFQKFDIFATIWS